MAYNSGPVKSSKERGLYRVPEIGFNLLGLILSVAVIKVGVDGLRCNKKWDLEIVRAVQVSYLAEILLSLIGVTRQSLLASFMQSASRIFISCFICGDKSVAALIMFCVWGAADALRFIYYILPIISRLRYLGSLILYPIGTGLEIYLMVMRKDKIGIISAVIYLPGFYYLFRRVKRKI